MGPRIQGGMSQAEYQALLQEDRQFQQEQADLARQRAQDEERRRREEERLEADRIKNEELQALQDLEDAEAEVLGEIGSQDEEEDLSIDFFGSLAEGAGVTGQSLVRPE